MEIRKNLYIRNKIKQFVKEIVEIFNLDDQEQALRSTIMPSQYHRYEAAIFTFHEEIPIVTGVHPNKNNITHQKKVNMLNDILECSYLVLLVHKLGCLKKGIKTLDFLTVEACEKISEKTQIFIVDLLKNYKDDIISDIGENVISNVFTKKKYVAYKILDQEFKFTFLKIIVSLFALDEHTNIEDFIESVTDDQQRDGYDYKQTYNIDDFTILASDLNTNIIIEFFNNDAQKEIQKLCDVFKFNIESINITEKNYQEFPVIVKLIEENISQDVKEFIGIKFMEIRKNKELYFTKEDILKRPRMAEEVEKMGLLDCISGIIITPIEDDLEMKNILDKLNDEFNN